MHVVVGVEHDGNDLLFQQPQEDLEIVAVVRDQLRVHHIGLVNIFVVVVILNQREGVGDGCARNERGGDPVVNQAIRHFDGRVPRPQLRSDVSMPHLLGDLGIGVGPQECAVPVQRRLHGGLGLADVRFERLQSARLQLHDVCSLRHKDLVYCES